MIKHFIGRHNTACGKKRTRSKFFVLMKKSLYKVKSVFIQEFTSEHHAPHLGPECAAFETCGEIFPSGVHTVRLKQPCGNAFIAFHCRRRLHPCRTADHNVNTAAVCVGAKHFNGIRFDPVVAVNKNHIFSRCPLQTEIACIGKSAVWLVKRCYIAVFSCICVAQFSAVVCASVVNKQYFGVFIRLHDKRTDTSVYIFFNIVYRYYHRYSAAITHCAPLFGQVHCIFSYARLSRGRSRNLQKHISSAPRIQMEL